MAKLMVFGKLGKVKEKGQNGEWLSFGVAEPSYKGENGEYVTPWFNFLIKGDSPSAKFLKTTAEKIGVVCVSANERQITDESGERPVTKYYHNVTGVEVITWRKAEETADTASANTKTSDDKTKFPWD